MSANEPTLAEIREKVEALSRDFVNYGTPESYFAGIGRGLDIARDAVLALLEPREKPEPVVDGDDTAATRAHFDALRNAPQFVSGPSVVLRRDLDAAINAAFGPKPKPKKRYVHEPDYDLWVVRDTSYGPNTFMSCCTDEHDARRIADALNATIVTVGGRPLADVQAEVARSIDVASAASEVPNTSFNQTGYGK